MTRINTAIRTNLLLGSHLLAEHREIKRIPNVIKSGRYNLSGIPAKFTLGSGHVKFFYNKLQYLHKRYEEIYAECLARGYNVTYWGEAWQDLPPELYNDYQETTDDYNILKQRLLEKAPEYYKNKL